MLKQLVRVVPVVLASAVLSVSVPVYAQQHQHAMPGGQPAPAVQSNPNCTATTDIAQFKDQIGRACGQRIQSVSLVGSHMPVANVVFTITYEKDLTGEQIAETQLAQQAWQSAVTAHTMLEGAYPMAKFTYAIKDTKGNSVCDFVFFDGDEKPAVATCMAEVG